MIWPSNHTSHTKVYFNEFVANSLRDNVGSKKSASIFRKINEVVFSFKYQKFRVRVNHTIRHNQKTKKQPQIFFLRMVADFFDPTLSRKAFATNFIEVNFCV